MARRRKEEVHISLVPILSIQKCAMGVMVVIICAQNLVALGKSMSQQDDQILEIPSGSEKDKEPVFVECQEKRVLIHTPEIQEVSLEDIKGPPTSGYHKLLDALEESGGRKYLVLLIRPDGNPTYDPCYRLAHLRADANPNFHMGMDAVLSGGRLILKKGEP